MNNSITNGYRTVLELTKQIFGGYRFSLQHVVEPTLNQRCSKSFGLYNPVQHANVYSTYPFFSGVIQGYMLLSLLYIVSIPSSIGSDVTQFHS